MGWATPRAGASCVGGGRVGFESLSSTDAARVHVRGSRRSEPGAEVARADPSEKFMWPGRRPYGRRTVHTAEIPTVRLAPAIDELLGSSSRIQVVKLLVQLPDKVFTGREIGRLLGLSHSTVQEALKALVAEGLVDQRAAGRAHAYQVNRESYLHGVLRTLFQAERRMNRQLVDSIRSALEGGTIAVVLYGSRARGIAGRGSDFDLMVITRDREKAEGALARLQLRLARRYGVRIDARILTPSELRAKRNVPYVRAALEEGLLLCGKPLDRVVTSAAQDPSSGEGEVSELRAQVR